MTLSHFSKQIKINHFSNKNRARHRVEEHEPKCGVHTYISHV